MSMPQGEQTFEFSLGKQFFVNMEDPEIHDADLIVELKVTHKADLYQFNFTIKGSITLVCDRCLDSLIMPIDTTYRIAVKYGDDYNDDNDDLLIIPLSDAYLNVAYMIHDTVALTIPIKHVHPMGKCNRRMSAILKNHRAHHLDDEDIELEESDRQPTDPRWDALKGFSDKSDDSDQ